MRFFLLVLLIFTPLAVAADPALNFTLTTGTAEISRDASSSRNTYTVKGDRLTYDHKSSGRYPLPSLRPNVSVNLSLEVQRRVRVLLAKLAKGRSVRLVPRVPDGSVYEFSVYSTGASPMTLDITTLNCQARPCGPRGDPFFDDKGNPLPKTPGALIKTIWDLEQVLDKAAHPH
jgi:hypothetical protein